MHETLTLQGLGEVICRKSYPHTPPPSPPPPFFCFVRGINLDLNPQLVTFGGWHLLSHQNTTSYACYVPSLVHFLNASD